jgi:hypothetical protein
LRLLKETGDFETSVPSTGPDARRGGVKRKVDFMGYFVITTVCTLQWLGYISIPKQILIAASVGYVLYDAFRR